MLNIVLCKPMLWLRPMCKSVKTHPSLKSYNSTIALC